jgi:methanogenic corrinoid protein MtbC1
VGEFFRREGWDVWDPHPDSDADLLRTVRRQWFSVISVTVNCEERLQELPALIAAMRRASRNRAVSVMVCGQPFVGHPERVYAVGADATATDGRLATQEAARLVDARARRL